VKLAILALTGRGTILARDLGRALPESEVHVPERFSRPSDRFVFNVPLAELVTDLFPRVDGLICIMATGIVVRVIAPLLRGKDVDPAVVVLDEQGSYAISLLSGHLGGANDLAKQVAKLSGGKPVITTATDVNRLPAWDDIARREGLAVDPIKNIRRLNSLLLEKGEIVLVDRKKRISHYFADIPYVHCMQSLAEGMRAASRGHVYVTHYRHPQWEGKPNILILRPRDLVVGIGCNRGTPRKEIDKAVEEVFARLNLHPESILKLATIVDKADEAGLNAFAAKRNLPVEHHDAAALNRVKVPSPPSEHVRAAVGANGVCEPAALLSAGSEQLLLPKQKCGNVTIAIAEKA